ncbi:MAG: hypothetical protein QOI47_2067 [Actinomycetota bacterium]|nr:hypothetical protein [Actinomycetota bacterium]
MRALRIRAWSIGVVGLVAVGVGERAHLLAGRWGAVDSDEAVVGLMARGFRHGHWRAFYWGQHYAGTQETALVALAGASWAALKLVPIVLCALAAVLTWRVGRRIVEDRLAQAAGLLVWVAPGSGVWWSTKERGFYWVTIVLGLVVVLAALRIVERGGRPIDWVAFGAAAGCGFWASPAILYFAVPATLWLVARRRLPPLRWAVLAPPAALLGALPWIWHNVGRGLPSLERPPQPVHISYATGIGRLLWRTLPVDLGLRWPLTERWVVPVVAPMLLLALGAAVVVASARRPRPTVLLVALAIFPFIYSWFPGAWFVGEGRYALFATPLAALAVAWVVRRPAVVLGIAVVASVVAVRSFEYVPVERPFHIGPDLAALRAAGVDHAWADYWVAYRLYFVSGGDIVASSSSASRERSVLDAVQRDRTPAFVYPRHDPRRAQLEALLRVPHRSITTPSFDVVLADGAVDVAALPPGVAP